MTETQDDIFGDDTHGNDLSKAEFNDVDEHRWPKAMAEFIDVLAASALRNGMVSTPEDAKQYARWAVLTLGKHFGGRQVYLPKGDKLLSALRDNQIWHDFNGKNHEDLAARHGLTVVRVYKIIAEQRHLHIEKLQPQLPFKGASNGA